MARAQQSASPDPRSLDISPQPLSIRTLDYRRAGAADAVNRVRGEFVEMRGFSPTIQQAARLFDLSLEECGRILTALVNEGFLRCTADGRYRLPV
jgi:hypothetical protein